MSLEPRASYDNLVAEMISLTPATKSQMFGMPCLKNNGKAFAGFFKDTMVFKLPSPQREEALTLTGAHLFDPMGGRPMKEWVVVPVEHTEKWTELAEAAMKYVGGN